MDEHERVKWMLEATTLKMFAVFFTVIGLFVLIGTYWARKQWDTTIISVASGLSLWLVAFLSLIASRRIHTRLRSQDNES